MYLGLDVRGIGVVQRGTWWFLRVRAFAFVNSRDETTITFNASIMSFIVIIEDSTIPILSYLKYDVILELWLYVGNTADVIAQAKHA